MSPLKNGFVLGGSSIVFILALLSTLFNATNPEYNFPGITESLLIGASFFAIALSVYLGRALTHREWFLGGILLSFIGILFLRYLWDLKLPGGEFAKACFLMPGYFQKLECLLQLPFSVHHGLRQILFHTTAFSVFLGAASLSRMSHRFRPWIVFVLSLPAVVIAISVLIPIHSDPNFSLVGYNFVFTNWWGHLRGKGIIANPSWLWPLLAPAMSMALGGIFAKRWSLRFICIPLFLLYAWASLSVMQRGGYLLVGVLIFALLIGILVRIIQKYSSLSLGKSTGLILVAGGMLLFLTIQNAEMLISSYGKLTHTSVRHNPVTASVGRLKMWSSAWEQSQKHFAFGSGYGTWLREARKMRGVPAYDTAHNLWVQMFFELGAFHASLILFILFLIGGNTLRYKNRGDPSIQAGGIFLSLSFLTVTLVQEVDYILPVYMQFAVFAGMCFGGVSYDEKLRKTSHGRIPYFLLALSFLSFTFSFFYAKSISWGGSGYDPVHNSIPKFNRWYRPKGAISATPDRQDMKYSLYLGSTRNMSQNNFTASGSHFPDVFVGINAIYLSNGSKWSPNQYDYEHPAQQKFPQRLVSFSLYQPSVQTDTLLLAEQNTFAWEFTVPEKQKTPKAGKWCKQTCQILLYRPNSRDKQDGVQLSMPLSGLNDNNSVTVTVQLQPLELNNEALLEAQKNFPTMNPLSETQTFIFKAPNQSQMLQIPWKQSSTWLISFKTDHAVVPNDYNSQISDKRKLGVFIIP